MVSRKDNRRAVGWFVMASQKKRNDTSGAFVETECYGFIPNILLCFCYGKLGEYEKAYEFNELAWKYKPEAIEYLHNLGLFKQGKRLNHKYT